MTHRMMRNQGTHANRRRQSTQSERLTPCQCCGWPISERHHLLEVARYGESNHTARLCANCHELYHIIYAAYEWEHDILKDPFKNRAALLEQAITQRLRNTDRAWVIERLYLIAQQAHDLKEQIGRKVPT